MDKLRILFFLALAALFLPIGIRQVKDEGWDEDSPLLLIMGIALLVVGIGMLIQL